MAASAQIPIPTGGTATPLVATDAGDAMTGDSFLLYNSGTVDVLLGGPNVTAATAFRALKVGATIGVDVAPGEGLWALSSSGSVAGSVDVLRVK